MIRCPCYGNAMVKGVFFDLGGTLFHYEGANRGIGSALMRAMTQLGAESTEHIGRAYGRANQEVAKEYAELDYYLHSDLFEETFRRAVRHLDLTFDDEVYGVFRDIQHRTIVEGLSLKEDCLATLEALKDEGLYLSIVSNIDEDMLQPLVARESLQDFLNHWTSSEAAQSCKPHERFFRLSLDLSGLQPSEVLFVGDSPEHDVTGAQAIGMQTALVRNGGLTAPLQSGKETREPDHTIDMLSELVALVRTE